MAHLFLSAAHKSSGKTTVAIGLVAAFAERGLAVQPFKKGPDFIDPLWLSQAAGRPCYNLDFNTQTPAEITATFAQGVGGSDLGIIEGNKGLHDGVDLKGRDSNAALAKLLAAPVILVLDTVGITRGIAPLVAGYQAFDDAVKIAGIILNKVGGPRHEGKLRAALEHYTDVPVLGALKRDDGSEMTERHLGLVTPGDAGEAEARVDRLRDSVKQGVDLERVLAIAKAAVLPKGAEERALLPKSHQSRIRLGVARDAAFCFYYADDLRALRHAGAELIFFNTLEETSLPDVDGLFIGGGFPETHLSELEGNASLRREIRKAAEAGLPIYAECGGLMYLCRSIRWGGEKRAMVGALQFDARMHARPQGRGLVQLEKTESHPWDRVSEDGGHTRFWAHEFHHAALENPPSEPVYAYRVLRGAGIDGRHDGIVSGNVVANFCHLRDTAQNRWASRFVDFVTACKRRSGLIPAGASGRDLDRVKDPIR